MHQFCWGLFAGHKHLLVKVCLLLTYMYKKGEPFDRHKLIAGKGVLADQLHICWERAYLLAAGYSNLLASADVPGN